VLHGPARALITAEVIDMPLPKSHAKTKAGKQKNVGRVMHTLKEEKPNMPQKQKVAIALKQSGLSKKKSGH
jgi:hypothetical protein